jgi:hypothetical protein
MSAPHVAQIGQGWSALVVIDAIFGWSALMLLLAFATGRLWPQRRSAERRRQMGGR